MPYNPVDYKVQDVKVILPGSYVGQTAEGQRLKINATDLPNIKGGLFASINSSEELTICDGDTETPVGMFYGDGTKEPKNVTIIIRGGVYAVKNWDTAAGVNAYAPGTKLVVDTAGKLTPQGMSTNDVVAVVLHKPATTSDYLGIKLAI